MPRIKRKENKGYDITDWPFTIDMDLLPPADTNNVAFLSGKERGYFPEDLGHSRLAIKFMSPKGAQTAPSSTYTGNPPGYIEKPAIISTKGYRMGTLSDSRFSKETKGNYPSPFSYNIDTKKRKQKKPWALMSSLERKLELAQANYIFGLHAALPRFGKESKFQLVGIGYYNLADAVLCTKLKRSAGFGGGPVRLKASTETYCNYESQDTCLDCGELLSHQDYYKSRCATKIPPNYPNHKASKQTGKKNTQRTPGPKSNINNLKTPAEVISYCLTQMKSELKSSRSVALCRNCYCKALKGHHPLWKPEKIKWLFQKVRHCGYIHHHAGLPIAIHKTTCTMVNKLSRKEAIMAKYCPDKCLSMF